MHGALAGVVALALVWGVRLKLLRLEGDRAAVVLTGGRWQVSFQPRVLVVPPVRVAEVIDLGPRTVEHTLRGAQALRFRDGEREDVRARLELRIDREAEAVL